MGSIIKSLGFLWIAIGALLAILMMSGSTPDVMPVSGMLTLIVFIGTFLVPGGMMYCVGDLHHKLVASQR